MNEAKIRLSEKEMELVTDAGWILTKNRIMEKGMQLLGQLQSQYAGILNQNPGLPDEIYRTSPKISRGENYKGLPWLVLDYPRLFGSPDLLAIRTMFWWGHFFSITLQLSGKYMERFQPAINKAYTTWAGAGYFYCLQEDPWQHHFESDNYKAISEMDARAFESECGSKGFIKIAARIPVNAWEEADQKMAIEFRRILAVLKD